MSGIGLTPEQVDQAFPFHIAFGADGRVVQLGSVLNRLCPGLAGGRIGDAFRIERPQPMAFDFDAIRQHPRTVFVLHHVSGTLRLKGQMLPLDPLMLFVGSPWITDLSELASLDLRLGDFAVHDQVVDCLFLIQAQQATLLEVEKLARERLQNELELARSIQVDILPRRLAADGLEVSACMMTATEIGGDYYDVLPIEGGCWIGIGDVSGHGVTSGLIMLMVQSIVAGLIAQDPARSPREAVTILNRVLFENIRHRLLKDDFVTFSLLRVVRGRVVFAGAHEQFLVCRGRGGCAEPIATPGTWLGVMPDIDRFTTETHLDLEPGDLVVLYTDGITEARNERGEQYGIERLGATVERYRDQPIEAIRDHVFAEVDRWAIRRDDDATLVLLRQQGNRALSPD